MAPKTADQIAVEELPQVALTSTGDEIPNPTPVEIPAGFKIPETTEERFQRMIRHSMSEWAQRNDAETFEDADDFDVGDDDDPRSPYEEEFDPMLGKAITPMEFQQREAYYRQKYAEQTKAYWKRVDLHRRMQDAGLVRPDARGAGGQPPASTSPVQPSSGENKPSQS